MVTIRRSFKTGIANPSVTSDSDKIINSYLNSLKCPICQSQLDGQGREPAHLYCVANPDEFRFVVTATQLPAIPVSEQAIIYHEKYRYCIKQSYRTNSTICSIYLEKVDKAGNLIGEKPKVLSFNTKLFDFQSLNRSSLISKLRTILVFQ